MIIVWGRHFQSQCVNGKPLVCPADEAINQALQLLKVRAGLAMQLPEPGFFPQHQAWMWKWEERSCQARVEIGRAVRRSQERWTAPSAQRCLQPRPVRAVHSPVRTLWLTQSGEESPLHAWITGPTEKTKLAIGSKLHVLWTIEISTLYVHRGASFCSSHNIG